MKLPNFFDAKKEALRISHDESGATYMIGRKLLSMIPESSPLAIVCIGTDRSTGDSLGPLVGTLLSEKRISNFHLYGTLEDPIHAVNLQEKLDLVHSNHKNPFILSIDACLGRLASIGTVTLNDGPLKPGAGVNKDLPEVGDAHITGVVNVGGFMEFMVLQNTRLHLVMKMAQTITNGIKEADFLLKRRSLQGTKEQYKFL